MSIFTKSVVHSTIALSLLAVIGTAQAQQGNPSAAGSATRKIEVITGKPAALAAQPDADVNAEASADARADVVADANQSDVDPREANAQSETAPLIEGSAPQRADTKVWVSEETKRVNRQRYVERYEARQQYEEPRYNNHHYAAPRYAEQRYVAPRYQAPREAYAQRYQAASSYGHVRRTAEHCAPRGY